MKQAADEAEAALPSAANTVPSLAAEELTAAAASAAQPQLVQQQRRRGRKNAHMLASSLELEPGLRNHWFPAHFSSVSLCLSAQTPKSCRCFLSSLHAFMRTRLLSCLVSWKNMPALCAPDHWLSCFELSALCARASADKGACSSCRNLRQTSSSLSSSLVSHGCCSGMRRARRHASRTSARTAPAPCPSGR